MAGTLNIADMKKMVEDYMVDTISKKHPDIDISTGSVFRDLFITPLSSVIIPFVERVSRMELKLNLANAAYLTEEELDEIGYGNYFLTRLAGNKATGNIVIGFSKIPENENIIIPTNTYFSTIDGYQFATLTAYTFTPAELINNYNTDTQMYEVTISVTAESVGVLYNVLPGTIVNIVTAFSKYATSVTNTESMKYGEDIESNVDYADRIKKYYLSRQLGTNEGYMSMIYESFPEVRDIFVVGKDSEYMLRDVGTFIDIENNTYTGHLGGKVDIYIQGSLLSTATLTLTCKSNNLLLLNDNVVTSSIVVYNAMDPLQTPLVHTYMVKPDGKTVVTVAYNLFTLGDRLTVEYLYNTTMEATEIFTVTTCSGLLTPPLDSISSIVNITKEEEYNISLDPELTYNITTTSQTWEEGTSKEVKTLNFVKSTAENGDEILVTYLYNSTVSSINGLFNTDNNRIITTDILIKAGTRVPVNIYMYVKTKETLDYELKLQIIAVVQAYFDSLKLGDSFLESDLVTAINNDEFVKSKLQYMAVPISSIYVPQTLTENIEDLRRDTQPMTTAETSYFVLNKIEIMGIG